MYICYNICPDIENRCVDMAGEEGDKLKSLPNTHTPLWLKCWRRLARPLDCMEIQPAHPKGDQSWVFIGRTDAEAETPVLWPPHEKS